MPVAVAQPEPVTGGTTQAGIRDERIRRAPGLVRCGAVVPSPSQLEVHVGKK